MPISIPHAIPKEETIGTCKVYVIWKVATNGKITVAKYGMTCTDDYEDNCNMRPESQCKKFNNDDTSGKKYFYNWVTRGISKIMYHLIERSLTAVYVIDNRGELPSHHYLPCFVKKDDFEKRMDKAEDWRKKMIEKYGK